MRASEAKSEAKRLARPDEQRSSESCAMRASESLRGQVRVLQARLGEQCREPCVMRATRPSKRRSEDRSGAVQRALCDAAGEQGLVIIKREPCNRERELLQHRDRAVVR